MQWRAVAGVPWRGCRGGMQWRAVAGGRETGLKARDEESRQNFILEMDFLYRMIYKYLYENTNKKKINQLN